MKQWNHILNHLQNQTIDKSTREHVHPYTNINHTHLDQNSQQLELQNIPIIEINKSNKTYTNVNNITSIYKEIFSPISIKNFIKEKYKLNKLQIFAFKTFTQMNSINQILQYVKGAPGIGKTKIINAIQKYFIKTNNEQKLRIATYIANATLLVGGMTIHSVLGLSINKHAIINKPNLVTNMWPTIEFIIVDEISMVGYNMFTTMPKLQKIKSNILPFNGVNILFMKDVL
jgi:hypothetical protein